MKTLIIIGVGVLLLFFFGYLIFDGRRQIKKHEENLKLLTTKNYKLIRDSPYTDEISKYSIRGEESKLWFSKPGYTLFYLELEAGDNGNVKLRGLDGYGIRDRQFLNYTCNLIRKIVEKNKQLSM